MSNIISVTPILAIAVEKGNIFILGNSSRHPSIKGTSRGLRHSTQTPDFPLELPYLVLVCTANPRQASLNEGANGN